MSEAVPRSAIPGVRCDLQELMALRGEVSRLAGLARRRVREDLGGTHLSPFRGRGMEYAESRPYASGDDARHIDWRVTARTGRAHTKLFQPERERTTAILYDRSPTMAFGTRACLKSVQAARLASLMVWLAWREGHRIAAAASGSALELIPPAGGRRGALRVLDALVRWQPDVQAGPAAQATVATSRALDSLRRALRPGSQILLLLDARSVDAGVGDAVARLCAHHDVLAGLLLDPIEMAAPPPGDYPVTDGRQGGSLHLGSKSARARWQAHFTHLRTSALTHLERAGAISLAVATDADPVDTLVGLLRGVRSGSARQGLAV